MNLHGCGKHADPADVEAGSTPSASTPSSLLSTHLVRTIALSADGKLLATVGFDEILVWSLPDGLFEHGFAVKGCRFMSSE